MPITMISMVLLCYSSTICTKLQLVQNAKLHAKFNIAVNIYLKKNALVWPAVSYTVPNVGNTIRVFVANIIS